MSEEGEERYAQEDVEDLAAAEALLTAKNSVVAPTTSFTCGGVVFQVIPEPMDLRGSLVPSANFTPEAVVQNKKISIYHLLLDAQLDLTR